ncbi:hypothetical protein C8A03DRAFT_35419 [Achaetomium macrosporum]|uniref:SWR1-complex protein 3 domain-containing protein n=1 Tax=Achaetomium macrosporum TaxID=79813 RepID=A0AAN7H9N0_9PEZI|nr:hypothetical protein C8A03DRAFT_35419 [Achaetomium macrosporum]
MEKKRKLPARAAARAEQAAKRRTMTPPQRSATPAPAPQPDPVPVEEIPPPLPKSISAGKPLPTVDSPQPDDLSSSEYQTVTESGVLAESLSRSRQRWTMEGIFEKYWSKPTKRKGVVIEEPNNPPKESMTKLGQVTITVEPHVFEATMFAVRDPKPPPPVVPRTERPIIQYGPPGGVMPPPPTPTPKSATPTGASTPTPIPAQPQPQTQAHTPAETKPSTQIPAQSASHTPALHTTQPIIGQSIPDPSREAPTIPTTAPRPVASPRGMESVLSPSSVTPMVPQGSPAIQAQPHQLALPTIQSSLAGTLAPTAGPPRPPNTAVNNPPPTGAPPTPSATTPAKSTPGTDPIILMLAEKAGTDPQLRDLMKRVAQGDAAKPELERFQAIIDAISLETKRNGSTTGPSADRLLVDGRTVRYFADEVRTILDIVLSSNPKQTSADLRPPAGSDPLVVMLVKAALDDLRLRDMVRRIAENKPLFSDATDLKVTLDGLRSKLVKDREPQRAQLSASTPPAPTKPGGASGNHPAPSGGTSQSPAPQQALRSKGPPPPPKPDISAIVFEFAGGNGDRYLFPKFSLLEYVQVPSGQQVIASFLLVRKGSKAEYPVADPELDYYEPLNIRLFAHTGRHLEHLARVVAPPDEVRRYMDNVMSRMTRAEYVLLAMRLPRRDRATEEEKEKEEKGEKEGRQVLNGGGVVSKEKEKEKESGAEKTPLPPQVLWTTKPAKPEIQDLSAKNNGYGKTADDGEAYQRFIASVTPKKSE